MAETGRFVVRRRHPVVRGVIFLSLVAVLAAFALFSPSSPFARVDEENSVSAHPMHRALFSVGGEVEQDPGEQEPGEQEPAYYQDDMPGNSTMTEEGGHAEEGDCGSLTKFEQYGGFLLEAVGVFYLFIGISIVADDYFITSLEIIADLLNMSPDIAGATLMAIGSSAPELFTNVASVLNSSEEAGNDIGAGTIVGSALFNILVVIGLSAYVAPSPLKLAPLPVIRDVFVYIISIALLTYAMWDRTITWLEALVMFLVYIGYVAYLAVSRYLVRFLCPSAKKHFEAVEVDDDDDEAPVELDSASSLGLPPTDEERARQLRKRSFDISHARKGLFRTGSLAPDAMTTKERSQSQIQRDVEAVAAGEMFDDPAWTQVSERKVAGVVIDDSDLGRVAGLPETASIPDVVVVDEEKRRGGAGGDDDGEDAGGEGGDGGDEDGGEEEEEETTFDKVYGIIAWPYVFLFRYTIPDCSEGTGWEKWYLVTFFSSLVWIGILTYFVVFLMTRIGCALHLSTAIMGLTLVAAGTSVPDCIGSVLVARVGEGDMAVSNAVGSNIFDILVGLAVPWLINCLAFHDVKVESKGLYISTLLLLAGLLIYAGVVLVQRFTLHKWTAYVLCISYAFYVAYEITAEVLGFHH